MKFILLFVFLFSIFSFLSLIFLSKRLSLFALSALATAIFAKFNSNLFFLIPFFLSLSIILFIGSLFIKEFKKAKQ